MVCVHAYIGASLDTEVQPRIFFGCLSTLLFDWFSYSATRHPVTHPVTHPLTHPVIYLIYHVTTFAVACYCSYYDLRNVMDCNLADFLAMGRMLVGSKRARFLKIRFAACRCTKDFGELCVVDNRPHDEEHRNDEGACEYVVLPPCFQTLVPD